ncbi:MAG TPA: DUF6229 family protein [Jatrophihabitans sp.]|nr:DUF6229 family protein [Jatrophihabitans sp.]
MSIDLLSRPEALVAAWRTSADDSNPAGPLFSTPYAEFDLTSDLPALSTCSSCTASRTGQCC